MTHIIDNILNSINEKSSNTHVHAAVSTTVNGMMSYHDKIKLDSMNHVWLLSNSESKKSILDFMIGGETVNNGKTILDRALASGYNDINIPKNVILVCSGAVQVPNGKTISGEGTIKFTTGNLRLEANAIITGITIDGSSKTNAASGISLLSGATGVKIVGCNIINVQHSGININGGCNDVYIARNTISGCGGKLGGGLADNSFDKTYQGMGIYASGATVAMTNLVIEHNEIHQIYGQGGIYLHTVAGFVLRGNRIWNTWFRGICGTGPSNGLVSGNIISYCGALNNTTDGVGCNGIFFNLTASGEDVIVHNNNISKVGENGIEGRLTAIDNTISDTGYYPGLITPSKEGIYVTAESKVINNFIIRPAKYGIGTGAYNNESNFVCVGNTIVSPIDAGIFVVSSGGIMTNGVISGNIIFGENDTTKAGIVITKTATPNSGFDNFRCGDNEIYGRTNQIHSTVFSTGSPITFSVNSDLDTVNLVSNTGAVSIIAGASRQLSGSMSATDKRKSDTAETSKLKIEAIGSLHSEVPTLTVTTGEPIGYRRMAPLSPYVFVSGVSPAYDSAGARWLYHATFNTTNSTYSPAAIGFPKFLEFNTTGSGFVIGFSSSLVGGMERFKVYVDGIPCHSTAVSSNLATSANGTYWAHFVFPTDKLRKIKVLFTGIVGILAVCVPINSIQYPVDVPTSKLHVIASSSIGDYSTCLDSSIIKACMLLACDFHIESEINSGYNKIGVSGYTYDGSAKLARVQLFQADCVMLYGTDDTDSANSLFLGTVGSVLNSYLAALPTKSMMLVSNNIPKTAGLTLSQNEYDLTVALKTKTAEKGITFLNFSGIGDSTGVPPLWNISTIYQLNDYVSWKGAIFKCIVPGGISGAYREPWKYAQWELCGLLPQTGLGSFNTQANDFGTRDTMITESLTYRTAVGSNVDAIKLANYLRNTLMIV